MINDVQSGISHSDESMGSCSSEKTKVLLERMRMLEVEKTCLVLENERQCEQYERCLDDITSQVLQAVMAQRVTNTLPYLPLYHMMLLFHTFCLLFVVFIHVGIICRSPVSLFVNMGNLG